MMFNDGWLTMTGIFLSDEFSKKLVERIINDTTNYFPSWRHEYLKELQAPTSPITNGR